VSYGWNATTGRLDSITYPSGEQVSLSYDPAGQVSGIAVGTINVATNIGHFPFGAPSGWTWGNGTAVSRGFDLDGRLTSMPFTAGGTRQVGYDPASRVTGLNDLSNPANNQGYGYDLLDRLTSWSASSSSRGYFYDANGNRTNLTIGADNYAYITLPNTNQLSSATGPAPARTFGYDPAGNTTGDGQVTWTYNDRGRLALVAAGGITVSYTHDGASQRVSKSDPSGTVVPSGTAYFVYDEKGKLLGEYDSSGAVIQEYVYLGEMLLAIVKGDPTSPEIDYVYTDQVGRPWVITNVFDQVRWRWDSSPFGELPATQDPSGLGAFGFNLRFPGQYFDAETGTFYNYYRDYDPQTGRYVQSDPIGLRGGLNTYAYVGGSPLSLEDRTGLGGLETLLVPTAVGAIIGGVSGGVGAAIQGGSIGSGVTRGALVGASVGAASALVIHGAGAGLIPPVVAAVGVTGLRATAGFVGNLAGQGVSIGDPCKRVSLESAVFSGIGGAITAPLGIGLGLAGTELSFGTRLLFGATSIPGSVVFNAAGAQVARPPNQCSCSPQ